MKTTTFVYCKEVFTGFHCWKNAPEAVAFLRDMHRHVFHVKLVVEVSHDDRDVEFITLKRELTWYLRNNWHERRFESSCEQIAGQIISYFTDPSFYSYKVFACEVSEDNENGAVVFVNAEVKAIQHHLMEGE